MKKDLQAKQKKYMDEKDKLVEEFENGVSGEESSSRDKIALASTLSLCHFLELPCELCLIES